MQLSSGEVGQDLSGPPQNHRFCGERRSSEVSEFSHLCGNERYEACDDEASLPRERERHSAKQGCLSGNCGG